MITVLCHGCFDLLHLGHIRYLKEAKGLGDRLVVSVTSDRFVNKGPGRPQFTAAQRAECLLALGFVDGVRISDSANAVPTILDLKPDVYVKGPDYSARDSDPNLQAEIAAVRSYGGRVHFTSGEVWSSSALIRDNLSDYPTETLDYLADCRARWYAKAVPEALDSIRDLRCFVAGETIIDEYVYCSGLPGKPSKEPIIAVARERTETHAGGVEAAAAHLRSFVGTVDVCSAFMLTKTRYIDRDRGYKLFEVYGDRGDLLIGPGMDESVLYDATIVADFGHGMIGSLQRSLLMEYSKFLAVNAQTNAGNHGFNLITKYGEADYVCIDAPEARLAVQRQNEPLEDVAHDLSTRMAFKHLIVTDGSRGCVTYQSGACKRIPAISTKVVDTMGAGDAFLVVTSALMCKGVDIELTGFIGNLVGAIKVGRVGHREPVTRDDVLRFAKSLLK